VHKAVRYLWEEPNSTNKAWKTKRFYWVYDWDTVKVTDNNPCLGARSAAFRCSNLITAVLIRIPINHLCWRTASVVDVEKYVWVCRKDIPVTEPDEEEIPLTLN
jgi:hypothetical protein